jgi:hypothetical protein
VGIHLKAEVTRLEAEVFQSAVYLLEAFQSVAYLLEVFQLAVYRLGTASHG